MWENILLGSLLLAITGFIHSAITRVIFNIFRKEHHYDSPWKRILHVDLIIFILMIATLSETLIWAFAYLETGAISDLEAAFYFSLVTYSTLGYGDIVLDEGHRLLSAFQAVNGVILLGWSTAIVVTAIQKVYKKQS